MKKSKIDFGEGGFQGFCIRHVEKFVLGVVAVLLVVFIYLGTQAPALEAGKSPDDLGEVVKRAESTLIRTKWDDVKAKRSTVSFTTEKDVLSVQAPVQSNGYPIVQIYNRPNFPRLSPRSDPKIIAPVHVQVTPMYGALHTRDGEDPQSALSAVTALGGARKRMGAGTYKPETPDGGYSSAYMMVITAAVPYGQQNREYERAFLNSPDYQMGGRDDVHYLWPVLERAEVTSDSDVPKDTDWKAFTKSADWKKYRAIVGESIQDASVDAVSPDTPNAITQPVPPLLGADLTEALKHPDIPLRVPTDLNKGLITTPDEETGESDVPPDAGGAPGDVPAGDEPPDSASLMDKALAEGYTVTARQLPTMRQAAKKQPKTKPGKKPKTGMMPGGSPTGSMGGSGGPPGMSGMPMMPGASPTGSMGGSGGPPGMSGGMPMMPGGATSGGAPNMNGMMQQMMGMGKGGMPGIAGMPNMLNQPRQVVPWKLVRFVDTTAVPGKKYKYRIRVAIEDPNRPQMRNHAPERSFLAKDVKDRLDKQDAEDRKDPKKEKYTYWRYSDYSEPSSAATLPSLTSVLAGGIGIQGVTSVTVEGRELDCPASDQTLKVLVVAWDKKLATHVPGETVVTHGSVMYFNKKALTKDENNKERAIQVVNPLAGDLRTLEKGYDWTSVTQVIDIHGGVPVRQVTRPAGTPTPKSASEVLLMDEHGNLAVMDELSSLTQYREFMHSGDAGAANAAAGGDFGEMPGNFGPAPGGFNIPGPSAEPGKAKPKK